MNEKERKDLALSKIILLALALIAIAVIIWLAWARPATEAVQSIDSFDECVAAGNPVRESYPEVCATKDGKQFSNPSQHIQRLVLKEWGVYALITGIKDAYYTYDAQTQEVTVSTRSLDTAVSKVRGCKSGLHAVTYQRAKPGDANPGGNGSWTEQQLQERGVQQGEYYYVEKSLIETACMPDHTDSHVHSATSILSKLRTGMRTLSAN